MLEILERIVAGKGELKDLDLLEELAVTITETALCGLGKSAALPVMSTLKTFRDEYVEHVVDKKCRSHNCQGLRRYIISPERCKGCSKCARNCPVDAISGKIKEPFVIDTDKCILCGDCVRTCEEIQGMGILDFAHRGSKMRVMPAFNKEMAATDCVGCGQCRVACPTGAITVKHNISPIWHALADPDIRVVVQIAPAVRIAVGDLFGIPKGENSLGKLVTALRMMGFDEIYDTNFGADLTVIEESKEFIERLESGENLPLFTCCCPAWVKFCETKHPDLVKHIGAEGLKEITVPFGDRELKIAIVNGLKNADNLMKKIKAGEVYYDFVEVMACKRGCVAGGGQPLPIGPRTKKARLQALYNIDKQTQIKRSEENPLVMGLYDGLLKGKVHKLLHNEKY